MNIEHRLHEGVQRNDLTNVYQEMITTISLVSIRHLMHLQKKTREREKMCSFVCNENS